MNDVKAYLNRYQQMKRIIKLLETELDILKGSAGDIRATDYSKDVVDGTRRTDIIGEWVAMMDKKEMKIEEKRQEARALMLEIYDAINLISDEKAELRHLLLLRYIHGKKWEDIAGELGYSVRNTTNLHNKALNELKKVMDRNE